MKALCLNYRVDFNKDHVAVIYGYANEDVRNNKFTWEIFLDAFKEAGRTCKYFPVYADIIEKVKDISYRGQTQTFEALPAHRDKEQAKKYLDMIRNKKFKEME